MSYQSDTVAPLTHWGLVMHVSVNWVNIKKKKKKIVKFKKSIWNCYQQNIDHFVETLVCLPLPA